MWKNENLFEKLSISVGGRILNKDWINEFFKNEVYAELSRGKNYFV